MRHHDELERLPAAVREILDGERLHPRFSPEVEAEAAALVARPGLDDPALDDAEAIPFVTVDGEGTRDLDQALHLERAGEGFRVRYAIADAAHYVRPGTALFAEALRRGASYYLPGLSVPMLPRALSEGAVSLGPGVPRRALVFDLTLDGDGQVRSTAVRRARIRSRAQLTFAQVQALLDAPDASPLRDAEFAPSLALLPAVGALRQLDAAAREVIRFHRQEVQVVADGDRLAAVARTRHEVERHNEQLSLLCNAEGGRLLCAAVGDAAHGIYRVHPAPEPARLDDLARQLDELVALHRLPDGWRWRRGASLAAWVDALPGRAVEPRTARIARALERQAVMVNVRSGFAAAPGRHFGVGAQPYARFSAPMREIVGVFVHKEAAEHLGLQPSPFPPAHDAALRDEVLASAEAARDRQRRLTAEVHRRVLDALLADDLARPAAARPARPGVVMGVTAAKVHVALEAPPLDVKLYVDDVEAALGTPLRPSPGGGALLDRHGAPAVVAGDAIAVVTRGHDAARRRWRLAPAAPER